MCSRTECGVLGVCVGTGMPDRDDMSVVYQRVWITGPPFRRTGTFVFPWRYAYVSEFRDIVDGA